MREALREKIRESLLSGSTWLRGFFMLVYAGICYLAIWITGIVILFQFGVVLLSGKPNERLLPVGQSLSLYIRQIFSYLTYNSDEKPFPLGSWPTVNEYDVKPVVNLTAEPEPPQKEINQVNG
jgi:hypothetical protein